MEFHNLVSTERLCLLLRVVSSSTLPHESDDETLGTGSLASQNTARFLGVIRVQCPDIPDTLHNKYKSCSPPAVSYMSNRRHCQNE